MATSTPNYNLKKPAPEDFYNIQDFNDNMDLIDQALAGDIDCGLFAAENEIALHNSERLSHQTLAVDGNRTDASSGVVTLEEHKVDSMAHQNLLLDGNNR